MLRPWVRWLPLALVIKIARKKSERIGVHGGSWWVLPFSDVMIKDD
ncbi:hypothetical protein VLK31_34865 [Variovorax sp. H27-G14]